MSKYVDTVAFNFKLAADMDMELEERNAECMANARKIERKLRYWWKAQTDQEHILIVMPGNLRKSKGAVNYLIELTQLHMDNELIQRFQSGVEEILQIKIKRKKTNY